MTVYLVGAGPGDPGLMTARALELIAAADVIVHDGLLPESALDGARPGARLIHTGARPGIPPTAQAEIDRIVCDHGSLGRHVVRLTGGDPFVFGHGGEEALALRAAGVPYEVVPGVTAGIAAAAYAGVPLTHGEAATAVAFLDGHEDPAKPENTLDWFALSEFPGTLVVYMGVRQLGPITQRLIEGGRSEHEPAVLVSRATFPDQRTLHATLGTIARRAEREHFSAPAIAMFGPVAALNERLAWFERRPLFGVSVVVTRARAQAGGLVHALRALGARVIEAPAIRIVELTGPAPDLSRYDLVCLTSPNGVHALFGRLDRAGRDARALAGARVAAIGPGSAAALAAHGVIADLVPERFVAEGLVEALADVPVRRALVARAAQARDVLPDALRERGAEVDVLALYETVNEPLEEAQRSAVAGAGYVTFTSSSTVRNVLHAMDGRFDAACRLVSIGPVTSATLREHGLSAHVEASRHDIDGLIEALVADVAARRADGGSGSR